ncbi:MAG: class II aldolase and adducin N-terminal domain-containing protein [Rhodosalinus sp.]|uniref:class II aldolase and adducin N-terminal domain-containing protein n=1 Tax=Rhodosalinus sp. TaxID=2047741 RepID=UPI003978E839
MNAPHHPAAADLHELRADLAAAFRWTARLDMHEGVANHFSVAIDTGGTRVLMNPNQMHFARIRASDLIEVDATDPATLDRPDAPDPTAWGLHGAMHRELPQARCVMHVHSPFATVLACLDDPTLPPLDQNACAFFDRVVVDRDYGGLAFEEEGARCAALFDDPKKKVMLMGNHGVMAIGATVAETFDRLYYFERAAATYIRALWTGRPLSVLPDEVAEKTAQELESYPGGSGRHLAELRALLDAEGSDYAE